MTHRDEQRLVDVSVAIAAIRSHLERGDLTDGLVFDAIRIRLLEIGEALLDTEPSSPWSEVARMRDHLAHRYFDTTHAIVRSTVEQDVPELESALGRMLISVRKDGVPGEDT